MNGNFGSSAAAPGSGVGSGADRALRSANPNPARLGVTGRRSFGDVSLARALSHGPIDYRASGGEAFRRAQIPTSTFSVISAGRRLVGAGFQPACPCNTAPSPFVLGIFWRVVGQLTRRRAQWYRPMQFEAPQIPLPERRRRRAQAGGESMSKLRLSWLPVVGLMLSLVLAGCSSDGDPPADTETNTGTGAAPAAATAAPPTDQAEPAPAQAAASIEVTSPVFNRIRRIPKAHSCGPGSKTAGRTYDQNFSFDADYPNTSPQLDWTGVPEGTVSSSPDRGERPGARRAVDSLADVEHPGRRDRPSRGGGDHDRRGRPSAPIRARASTTTRPPATSDHARRPCWS